MEGPPLAYASVKHIALEEIPIIDVGDLASDDRAMIDAVGAQMREAAERIGFFYVRNHGVAPALVERAYAASRAFFAQPDTVKRVVTINDLHRGFLSVGGAKMYSSAKIDLKESYLWGLELGDDDPDVAASLPLRGHRV